MRICSLDSAPEGPSTVDGTPTPGAARAVCPLPVARWGNDAIFVPARAHRARHHVPPIHAPIATAPAHHPVADRGERAREEPLHHVAAERHLPRTSRRDDGLSTASHYLPDPVIVE